MALMVDNRGERVSRAMVEAVPTPAATDTWFPIPYAQTLEFMEHSIERHLPGMPIVQEEYALARKGQQLFAAFTLETSEANQNLIIAARSAIDRSLGHGLAAGGAVTVCTNLILSGSAFKVTRKHTRNGWGDFVRMVEAQMSGALQAYERVSREADHFKEVACNQRRGYSYLGVMLGEGLLTPTQANVAIGDWREPRHQEFGERNVWSLYNCVTEGLKKGAAGNLIERHTQAHAFFTDVVAA